jgi:hypothetical protein
VEPVEDAVEDLLAAELALAGGVDALPLQGGAELDGGGVVCPFLVRGGDPGPGSRWSARSAARTNDLDAGADPPHADGRVGEAGNVVTQVMSRPRVVTAQESGQWCAGAQPYLGPQTGARRH